MKNYINKFIEVNSRIFGNAKIIDIREVAAIGLNAIRAYDFYIENSEDVYSIDVEEYEHMYSIRNITRVNGEPHQMEMYLFENLYENKH